MSTGSLLRTIVLFTAFISAVLVLSIQWFAVRDRATDYPVSLDGMVVPAFDHQRIDFVPEYDKSRTLPFVAAAVVDIDGDGVEELFFGGGIDQQDVFYRFEDGRFTDITDRTGWSKRTPDTTFGAVSLDLDHDGDNDMLVTRQSGVFLYRNDGAVFTSRKLDLDIDAETVPLSVAVADIDRNGQYDFYMAGYIAREFVEGETIFNQRYGGVSALFLNTGEDTFENITEAAGLLYQHNTFQAMFIDVDEDNLEDLVVAHDTGQVRTWKNLGDLTFENVPNPSSDYYSYPMGIAVTDLHDDGLPDFFFSNVGSTVPDTMVRGDLRDEQVLHKDWLLFENGGRFAFTDVADSAQVADFEFSWGAIFEDFNLDGRDDLVVSENYEGWPLHKVPFWRLNGRFLLQAEDGTFVAAGAEAGVRNREFGITPLTGDFNQDGYPDLVHANLLGPQNAFLSKGGEQGYLKVGLPNTVESIGAVVRVELDDGSSLVRTFVSGEGLVSDQSHVLVFGLGRQSARRITVERLSGPARELNGEFRNEFVNLSEES